MKKKAYTATQVIFGILTIAAFCMGIAALALRQQSEEDRALGLWDDTTQTLTGAGEWTDITFGHMIHLEDESRVDDDDKKRVEMGDDEDDDWHHARNSARIRAKHDGVFTFSISVQAGLIDPTTVAPSAAPTPAPPGKKRSLEEAHTEAPTLIPTACNGTISYSIRMLRQFRHKGKFHELKGSITWVTHSVYLSKTFAVHAHVGDVFKAQFMSTCQYVVLTPVPLSGVLLGALSDDDDDDVTSTHTFPSSATLMIG